MAAPSRLSLNSSTWWTPWRPSRNERSARINSRAPTRSGSNTGPIMGVCHPGSGDPYRRSGPTRANSPGLAPMISPSRSMMRHNGEPQPHASSHSIHARWWTMRELGNCATTRSQSRHSAGVAFRTVSTSVHPPRPPGPPDELARFGPHIMPVQHWQTRTREVFEAPHQQRTPPAPKLGQRGDLLERRRGRRAVAAEDPTGPNAPRREPWLRGEQIAQPDVGGGVQHRWRDVASRHRCGETRLAKDLRENVAAHAPLVVHPGARLFAKDVGVSVRVAPDHMAAAAQVAHL